ncbi:FAD-dependent oxidoreductase [Thermodesulfobacteriota bacterium]
MTEIDKDLSSGLNQVETLKADVAVIGAGGSGLVAALTAAECGADVIVFEKRAVAGGTSNFPSGPFAAESKMQRQKYMRVTRDEVFKLMMDYCHWRTNPRLVRAIVDKSGSTIEWLQGQGVEFIDVMAMTPGGLPTWHLLKGHGAPMIKALLARAKEKGVEIRLSTTLREIIMERDVIGGVIVEDKTGNIERVSAKTVIIATGGYANNKEWIKKYTGFDLGLNLFPPADLKLMGDGIKLAWDAGAAEEGMGVLILQYTVPGPGIAGTRLTTLARQPYLWINQHGRRFCDEGITANWPFAGNAITRQENRCAYLVFDVNSKRYMEEKGFQIGAGPTLPTARPDNIDTLFKTALDKGNENVFKADSLKELGKKIGVNPDVLRETVDEYNIFCEQGHDDLFAKDPEYLQPVKVTPLFALRILPRFLGTLGGIKINEKTEVLDKEQEVIPGLYAAGNDASGMYIGSYDLWIPGGALGFALNSGRIAGENSADYSHK